MSDFYLSASSIGSKSFQSSVCIEGLFILYTNDRHFKYAIQWQSKVCYLWFYGTLPVYRFRTRFKISGMVSWHRMQFQQRTEWLYSHFVTFCSNSLLYFLPRNQREYLSPSDWHRYGNILCGGVCNYTHDSNRDRHLQTIWKLYKSLHKIHWRWILWLAVTWHGSGEEFDIFPEKFKRVDPSIKLIWTKLSKSAIFSTFYQKFTVNLFITKYTARLAMPTHIFR